MAEVKRANETLRLEAKAYHINELNSEKVEIDINSAAKVDDL